MKLRIENIKVFNTFLASVSKLINSAEFEVSKDVAKVCASNEVLRGFFSTNAILLPEDSDEPSVKFCVGEVNRLHKVMTMVARDVVDGTVFELDFDGTFISYDGTPSFRLKTVKRELIEKYITQPVKSELRVGFSFMTSSKDIRSVVQASNIISGDNNKVYFSKRGESVFAEVDDKSVSFNDSIAIPISPMVEGNIPRVLAIRMDDFISFALLECGDISVKNINETFFRVDSRVDDGDRFVAISLFVPTVKG